MQDTAKISVHVTQTPTSRWGTKRVSSGRTTKDYSKMHILTKFSYIIPRSPRAPRLPRGRRGSAPPAPWAKGKKRRRLSPRTK